MDAATECLFAAISWLFASLKTDPAEWLQALGSLVALYVAIRVPYRLEKSRQREANLQRELSARSLAIAIIEAMELLYEKLMTVRQQTNADGIPQTISYFDRANNALTDEVSVYLRVPKKLKERAEQLHLLGAAAEVTQRSVYFSAELEDVLDRYAWGAAGGHDQTEEFRQEANRLLERAFSDTERAVEMLRELLQKPVAK